MDRRMQRKLTEALWAKNKYDTMARGYDAYKTVQRRMNEAQATGDYLPVFKCLAEIRRTRPYRPSGIATTAEHLWGYFKKQASVEEKEQFKALQEKLTKSTEAAQALETHMLPFFARLSAVHREGYVAGQSLLGEASTWNTVHVKEGSFVIIRETYISRPSR